MINIIKLGYTPHACCWVHRRGQVEGLLAVLVIRLPRHPRNLCFLRSDSQSGTIRIYDGRGSSTPVETIEKLHRFPVHVMAVRPYTPHLRSLFKLVVLQYSDRYDTVISADEGGFVEYWKPVEPFGLPKDVAGLWSYKTETDLYEFKKVCSARVFLSPAKNNNA
jgi:peptidylprolyl isomerase domain and WD repeat-containing protein 1